MSSSSCPTCGASLGALARFCPQCGTRVEEGGTTSVQDVPPHESTRAPAVVVAQEPSFYGITPPIALLVLGAASVAVAVLLLLQGSVVAGVVVLAFGIAVLGAFLVSERKRDVERARERAGALVEQIAVRSGARRTLLRLRHELEHTRREREVLLRDLGAAVYGGDEPGIESARAALSAVDDTIAAKETEMSTITTEAEERVQRVRLQAQPTMIDPPQPGPPTDPGGPVTVPEPYPPPDEGDIPSPTPVPEPYPPPDEATPPQPR